MDRPLAGRTASHTNAFAATATALLLALMLATLAGCHTGLHTGGTPHAPDVRIEAPAISAKEAHHLPGLHNLVTYADDLLCGGVPDDDAGFASLAAMGIKTVLSVDGAKPDLKRAHKHGLRYVHLPISYDTVTVERQRDLAQAITNLEGPIYVHCHHGKHRSGAALATALVRAGKLTVEQVCERMGVSGTAHSYTGLWAAVREATPLSQDELRADPASFPSVTEVTGMVATMAEIDQVIDLVRQAHDAKWQAPDDHPDLVAKKETQRLAELMRSLRADVESQQFPADYQQQLEHSIEVSTKLNDAVHAGNAIQAAQLLATLGKSCKSCHRTYRNK